MPPIHPLNSLLIPSTPSLTPSRSSSSGIKREADFDDESSYSDRVSRDRGFRKAVHIYPARPVSADRATAPGTPRPPLCRIRHLGQ
jgi:hypothetical protein